MKNENQQLSLDYYQEPEGITRIKKHLGFVRWLTNDVRAICRVVQGILVHDNWLHHYGINLRPEQIYDQNSWRMEDLLNKAVELDKRSLAIARSPEKRVIGCCREFATLLCAILRHKGIPARSRCGFATYLANPGYYEDHWICEYWDSDEERWVRVDPQIDPFQQSLLSADFSPMDVPESRFLVAGQAWKQCRAQESDPERFGIACSPRQFGLKTLYGLWFVRGNLLRDFAALNKVETVPFLLRLGKGLTWDAWRLVVAKEEDLSQSDYALLDAIAELSLDPDKSFREIRNLYTSQKEVQPPEMILFNDLESDPTKRRRRPGILGKILARLS
jgi:hypothetical protein